MGAWQHLQAPAMQHVPDFVRDQVMVSKANTESMNNLQQGINKLFNDRDARALNYQIATANNVEDLFNNTNKEFTKRKFMDPAEMAKAINLRSAQANYIQSVSDDRDLQTIKDAQALVDYNVANGNLEGAKKANAALNTMVNNVRNINLLKYANIDGLNSTKKDLAAKDLANATASERLHQLKHSFDTDLAANELYKVAQTAFTSDPTHNALLMMDIGDKSGYSSSAINRAIQMAVANNQADPSKIDNYVYNSVRQIVPDYWNKIPQGLNQRELRNNGNSKESIYYSTSKSAPVTQSVDTSKNTVTQPQSTDLTYTAPSNSVSTNVLTQENASKAIDAVNNLNQSLANNQNVYNRNFYNNTFNTNTTSNNVNEDNSKNKIDQIIERSKQNNTTYADNSLYTPEQYNSIEATNPINVSNKDTSSLGSNNSIVNQLMANDQNAINNQFNGITASLDETAPPIDNKASKIISTLNNLNTNTNAYGGLGTPLKPLQLIQPQQVQQAVQPQQILDNVASMNQVNGATNSFRNSPLSYTSQVSNLLYPSGLELKKQSDSEEPLLGNKNNDYLIKANTKANGININPVRLKGNPTFEKEVLSGNWRESLDGSTLRRSANHFTQIATQPVMQVAKSVYDSNRLIAGEINNPIFKKLVSDHINSDGTDEFKKKFVIDKSDNVYLQEHATLIDALRAYYTSDASIKSLSKDDKTSMEDYVTDTYKDIIDTFNKYNINLDNVPLNAVLLAFNNSVRAEGTNYNFAGLIRDGYFEEIGESKLYLNPRLFIQNFNKIKNYFNPSSPEYQAMEAKAKYIGETVNMCADVKKASKAYEVANSYAKALDAKEKLGTKIPAGAYIAAATRMLDATAQMDRSLHKIYDEVYSNQSPTNTFGMGVNLLHEQLAKGVPPENTPVVSKPVDRLGNKQVNYYDLGNRYYGLGN